MKLKKVNKKVKMGTKLPNISDEKTNKIVKIEKPVIRKRKANSINTDEKRKRVSFADHLEDTKLFDKTKKLKIISSSANPGKGIIASDTKSISSGVMKEDFKDSTSTEVKVLKELSNESPINEHSSRSFPQKKKKQIQVTRKEKDKLMSLSRKERKEYIRKLQKKRKPYFDVALKCKIIWEKLRCSKTSDDERKKCLHEIYNLVKGKTKELIYAHDTCRVIECLVSAGDATIRSQLFDELTSEIIRMAKSKYSKFFVTKMMKHGTPHQRQIIFDAFRGHCAQLMRIAVSAQVLEIAYNEYANAQQRYNILIEFYAKEFHVFKESKDSVRSLNQIIADDPSKKASILTYLGQVLKDIITKSQVKLSLTHHLLNSYLQLCNSDDLCEMIDSLKLSIPEMVHTNDGSRVAMKCIWNGSVKDRKIMVKNFKGLVVKTAQEEFGYRVLIAIFDTLDDTVLVNKYILQELMNNIDDVIKNTNGLKVVQYLVHPKDPRVFSKSQLAIFTEGTKNLHSKKDISQRSCELFDFIKKPLLQYCAGNMDTLLFEKRASLLVLDILESRSSLDSFERKLDPTDRSACYNVISSICCREFIPFDTEKLHAIEHPQAHFVISKLLKSDSSCDGKLADLLVKDCGKDLTSWLSCNKGCFILLHMLENGSSETQSFLKSIITPLVLKRYQTTGALLLRKKLFPDDQ